MSALQTLFFDGHANNVQVATPITNYMPVVIGGTLEQNGAVGNGPINFSSNTSAKGGDLSFTIPVMPFLMNLQQEEDLEYLGSEPDFFKQTFKDSRPVCKKGNYASPPSNCKCADDQQWVNFGAWVCVSKKPELKKNALKVLLI